MGLQAVIARGKGWLKNEAGRPCTYVLAAGGEIATRYIQDRDAQMYADVEPARESDQMVVLICANDVPTVSRLGAGAIGTGTGPGGDRVVIGETTWWVIAILSDGRESGGWHQLKISSKQTPGQ